jgi:hypothetical protein
MDFESRPDLKVGVRLWQLANRRAACSSFPGAPLGVVQSKIGCVAAGYSGICGRRQPTLTGEVPLSDNFRMVVLRDRARIEPYRARSGLVLHALE